MRGIDEDKAIEIGEQIDSCKYLECSVKEWLRDECEELNPWLPLEEFLKSGFEGLCWVILKDKTVDDAYFNCGKFFGNSSMEDIHDTNCITRVQPIHKPEPPR